MADYESLVARAMQLKPELTREDAESRVMDYYVDRAMKLKPDLDQPTAEYKVMEYYKKSGIPLPKSRTLQSVDTGAEQSTFDPGAEAIMGGVEPPKTQRERAMDKWSQYGKVERDITAPAIELALDIPTLGMATAIPAAYGAVKGAVESPRYMEPDSSVLDKAGVVAKSALRGAVGESPLIDFTQESFTGKSIPRVSEGENVSEVNRMVTGSPLPEWSKRTIDVGSSVLGYSVPEVAAQNAIGNIALPKRGDFSRQTPTSIGDELGRSNQEALAAERARMAAPDYPTVVYGGGGNVPVGFAGSDAEAVQRGLLPVRREMGTRGVVEGFEKVADRGRKGAEEVIVTGEVPQGFQPAMEQVVYEGSELAPGGKLVDVAERTVTPYQERGMVPYGRAGTPQEGVINYPSEVPYPSVMDIERSAGIESAQTRNIARSLEPLRTDVMSGVEERWRRLQAAIINRQDQEGLARAYDNWMSVPEDVRLRYEQKISGAAESTPPPLAEKPAATPPAPSAAGALPKTQILESPQRPTVTLEPTVAEGVSVPVEQPISQRPTQTLPVVTDEMRAAAQQAAREAEEAATTTSTKTQTLTPPQQPTLSMESVTSGKLPVPNTEEGSLKIPENALGRAWTAFKRFWSPLSTLPETEKYQAIRNQTLGELDRVERFTEKVWKKTKDMTPDDKRDIFRYLDGQLEESALTPTARPVAVRLRYLNNEIGKMLVKRGMLSQETFDANKDKYVRYLYLKHVLGEDAKIAVGQSGRLDLDYLKQRKDLTSAQRRAIGLIEDVSVAQPVGMSKPLSDIAKFDMFADVAQNPNWVWTPGQVEVVGLNGKPTKMGVGKLADEVKIQRDMYRQAPNVPEIKARLDNLETALAKAQAETKNVPRDFVQLPNDKHYGDLAGSFVRKEIARDIVPVFSGFKGGAATSELVNAIISASEKGMAAYKVSKTALNIPTAARNIVSNFIQLNMSGIPVWDIPKHMLDAANSMKNGDQLYVLAKRNGLFKTNWAAGEIDEVLATVKTMQGDGIGIGKILKGVSKLAKYYGKIDDFYKLAKFNEQIKAGKTIQEAAIQANKWGMDYSVAHPSVKLVRKHIAPFVSYFYKILPLVAETMKTRPWIVPMWTAVPYAMNQVAKKTLNLTEEDWTQLQRTLPLFVKKNKTMALMPWKSPEGHAQWVNLEYFFPWQQAMAIARDVKRGAAGEIVTDLGVGNPFMDIYAVAKGMRGDSPPKDLFTGAPIYNKLDSPTDKAVATALWLYKKWAPSMATKEGAIGSVARIGEKDKYGRTLTAPQALGKFAGINIVAPTPKQAFSERQQKILELKTNLNMALKDPTINIDKKRKYLEEFKKQYRDILGVDPSETETP